MEMALCQQPNIADSTRNSSLMHVLHTYQKCGYLCDTMLTSRDGGYVVAHSAILAAMSPVLAQELKQCNRGFFCIDTSFSFKILQKIIETAYCGGNVLTAESEEVTTEIYTLFPKVHRQMLDHCKSIWKSLQHFLDKVMFCDTSLMNLKGECRMVHSYILAASLGVPLFHASHSMYQVMLPFEVSLDNVIKLAYVSLLSTDVLHRTAKKEIYCLFKDLSFPVSKYMSQLCVQCHKSFSLQNTLQSEACSILCGFPVCLWCGRAATPTNNRPESNIQANNIYRNKHFNISGKVEGRMNNYNENAAIQSNHITGGFSEMCNCSEYRGTSLIFGRTVCSICSKTVSDQVPKNSPIMAQIVSSSDSKNIFPQADKMHTAEKISDQVTQLPVSSTNEEHKFVCKICVKNFCSRGNLKRHMSKCHSGMSLDSDVMSTNEQPANSASPMVTSTEKKRYKCVVCGKGFDCMSTLNRHMGQHPPRPDIMQPQAWGGRATGNDFMNSPNPIQPTTNNNPNFTHPPQSGFPNSFNPGMPPVPGNQYMQRPVFDRSGQGGNPNWGYFQNMNDNAQALNSNIRLPVNANAPSLGHDTSQISFPNKIPSNVTTSFAPTNTTNSGDGRPPSAAPPSQSEGDKSTWLQPPTPFNNTNNELHSGQYPRHGMPPNQRGDMNQPAFNRFMPPHIRANGHMHHRPNLLENERQMNNTGPYPMYPRHQGPYPYNQNNNWMQRPTGPANSMQQNQPPFSPHSYNKMNDFHNMRPSQPAEGYMRPPHNPPNPSSGQTNPIFNPAGNPPIPVAQNNKMGNMPAKHPAGPGALQENRSSIFPGVNPNTGAHNNQAVDVPNVVATAQNNPNNNRTGNAPNLPSSVSPSAARSHPSASNNHTLNMLGNNSNNTAQSSNSVNLHGGPASATLDMHPLPGAMPINKTITNMNHINPSVRGGMNIPINKSGDMNLNAQNPFADTAGMMIERQIVQMGQVDCNGNQNRINMFDKNDNADVTGQCPPQAQNGPMSSPKPIFPHALKVEQVNQVNPPGVKFEHAKPKKRGDRMGNPIFECHVCGTVVSSKGNLKRHLNKHTDAEKRIHDDFERENIKVKDEEDIMDKAEHFSDKEQNSSDEELSENNIMNSEDESGMTSTIHNLEYSQGNISKSPPDAKNKPERHPCEVCGRVLSRKAHLKRHMITHSDLKRCHYCDKAFSRMESLEKHQATHQEKSYTCSFCGRKFSIKGHYKKHMQTHSVHVPDIDSDEVAGDVENAPVPERNWNLPLQNVMTDEVHASSIPPSHNPVKTEIMSPWANTIEQPGASSAASATHLNQQRGVATSFHGGQFLQNNMPGTNIHESSMDEASVDDDYLVIPPYMSSMEHRDVSDQSDETSLDVKHFDVRDRNIGLHDNSNHSTDDSNMSIPMVNINSSKGTELKPSYRCQFCDKAFSRQDNLKIHESLHTGEKPFKCLVCNKSFGNKWHLKRHQPIHSGQKPHKCQWCRSSFSIIEYLRKHERRHHAGQDKSEQNEMSAASGNENDMANNEKCIVEDNEQFNVTTHKDYSSEQLQLPEHKDYPNAQFPLVVHKDYPADNVDIAVDNRLSYKAEVAYIGDKTYFQM